jgi:hypothetical protein
MIIPPFVENPLCAFSRGLFPGWNEVVPLISIGIVDKVIGREHIL